MPTKNRDEILKKEGYVETNGPGGTRRIFTPEEYKAFMEELDAYPDNAESAFMWSKGQFSRI